MNGLRRASAVALLAMMACVLADVVYPSLILRFGARGLLLAYVALEWPPMATNARIVLGVAAAMTAAFAALRGSPAAAIATALDNGTFFATFFANQFFLREAARTSRLVARCSSFFINQPPQRRYGLLTLGGYLFGMIVNLGVLSLLGLMIKRRNTLAAADGNETIRAIRERRMVLALLRGFSVTPLASPMSMSLAVLLTALPGLRWGTMVSLGLASGALLLGLGWLVDWLGGPRPTPGRQLNAESESDYPALAGVTLIVMAVLVLANLLEWLLAVPLGRAILVALPMVGLGWLATQYWLYGPVKGGLLLGRRIVGNAAKTFPLYRSEIAILAGAGFIGSLFAAFVPPDALAALLAAPWLPPLALAPALMIAVTLAGLLGINPIVAVTILASALKAAAPPAVPLETLALALMIGWSITINCSALTASAMIMADLVKTTAKTIVLGWNGVYSALAVLMTAAWLVGLGVLL